MFVIAWNGVAEVDWAGSLFCVEKLWMSAPKVLDY